MKAVDAMNSRSPEALQRHAAISGINPLSRDAISARAFEKWLSRNGSDGSELQDWLEAEAEHAVRIYVDVVENMPVGVVVYQIVDSDDWRSLRLLAANSTASNLLGIRLEEYLGRTVIEAFPNADESRAGMLLEAARTGRSIDLGDTQYGDDRITKRWWRCRAFPMSNGNVAMCFEDVSERKQSEQYLRAEQLVSRILVDSADLIDAAARVLESICESLGWDVGALWVVDRQSQVLRCVDVWHSPMVEVTEFERATRQRTFVPGIGLPGRVWKLHGPAWVPDVTCDDNFPRAAVAAKANLHAACAFPILDGADVLGVAEFFSHEIAQPDDKLFELMASIGYDISQYIERRNAEKALVVRENEFSLARQIQQGLLPQKITGPAGFKIGGACHFAQETGGDYWDLIPLPDGQFMIAIGDAVGHGIGAALIMAEARACLRTLAISESDVGRVLALANDYFCTQSLETLHFFTVLLVKIDPHSRSLVSAGAAHPPGYIVDRNGDVRANLESMLTLPGLQRISNCATAPAITLQPDDLVFLLTDGVVEAPNPQGERFGVQRALSVVREHRNDEPDEIIQALFQTLNTFRSGMDQEDDWTAVIIKVDDEP